MGNPKEPPPTLYFGYGSNLWLAQMTLRCSTSTYLGIGRLPGYKWIINERGYANVVQTDPSTAPTSSAAAESEESHDYTNEVWGLVYSLQPRDEEKLDVNEGVPEAYTKEWMEVDFWAQPHPESREALQGRARDVRLRQPEQVGMLVYIDLLRTEPAEPRKEYIVRMNKGILDAVGQGMPEAYVREVLREFIPEGSGEGGGEVEALARRQAARFEDESGVYR